jgi:uncharacterized protein (DUF427 family)
VRPRPDPKGPGQESVWDYPRPPLAEPTARRIEILHRGLVIADSVAAVRTLETSHPPTYYLPPSDVDQRLLAASGRRSFCEFKGLAVYYDLAVPGERLEAIAWSYPEPSAAYQLLKARIAFYAGPLDRCTVDGEPALAQPGGFYGGWITSREAGPFKGVPGSRFW